MTDVRRTTDRATKWMRQIARALALICAILPTLVVGAILFDPIYPMNIPPRTWDDLLTLLFVALVLLLVWGGAAIPWRWERAGGVVLLLEGLLVFIWRLVMYRRYPEAMVFAAIVALPPVVAGSLFLASWWRSGRSGTLQESAQEHVCGSPDRAG
jgi:hypothetical protein